MSALLTNKYYLNQIYLDTQNNNKIYWVYLIYEKIIQELKFLISAIENNDIKEQSGRSTSIYNLVELGLLNSLDLVNGGELAVDLKNFYIKTQYAIISGRYNNDSKELKLVLLKYIDLSKAWLEISNQVKQ